jgi:hypothetical protein
VIKIESIVDKEGGVRNQDKKFNRIGRIGFAGRMRRKFIL